MLTFKKSIQASKQAQTTDLFSQSCLLLECKLVQETCWEITTVNDFPYESWYEYIICTVLRMSMNQNTFSPLRAMTQACLI